LLRLGLEGIAHGQEKTAEPDEQADNGCQHPLVCFACNLMEFAYDRLHVRPHRVYVHSCRQGRQHRIESSFQPVEAFHAAIILRSSVFINTRVWLVKL